MASGTFRHAAAAALLVFAASGASGQAFTSAHWKSTVEVEGGRQGGRPMEYEIWWKEGKTRMKTDAAGMSVNMLKVGDEMYTWADGQSMGAKMNIALSQRANRPSSDYVTRIEEYRSKGKKVGSETIDGHPCEIWEYTDERGAHGRYWLAQDLKNFPVQAVIETSNSKATYKNRDIQVPASVPDSMMAIPSDVEFQDMSEMMKGMTPKQ